jgi:hypothetical protein
MIKDDKPLKNVRKKALENRIKGRHKICLNCLVEFCSITPTGYRTPKQICCSEICFRKYGVEKRHKNGTYCKNEQAIEKMQATKLAKNPDYGKKWAAVKQGIQERGLGGFDRSKYKHWSQTPEGRKKISEIHTGRQVSDSTRKIMSERMQKLLHDHPSKIYSNANGGKRADLNNQYFRSNWEANYARILNEQKINWVYEPETFTLSNGTTYTPDFKIDEKKFVELKGWFDNDSKQKIELFLKEYPDYELDLIGETEYYSLRNLFKHKILNWEGK